jgi:hypothetical protein
VVAIRVLLADDSEDILADLREELSKEFDIVGTAGNGEEVAIFTTAGTAKWTDFRLLHWSCLAQ